MNKGYNIKVSGGGGDSEPQEKVTLSAGDNITINTTTEDNITNYRINALRQAVISTIMSNALDGDFVSFWTYTGGAQPSYNFTAPANLAVGNYVELLQIDAWNLGKCYLAFEIFAFNTYNKENYFSFRYMFQARGSSYSYNYIDGYTHGNYNYDDVICVKNGHVYTFYLHIKNTSSELQIASLVFSKMGDGFQHTYIASSQMDRLTGKDSVSSHWRVTACVLSLSGTQILPEAQFEEITTEDVDALFSTSTATATKTSTVKNTMI